MHTPLPNRPNSPSTGRCTVWAPLLLVLLTAFLPSCFDAQKDLRARLDVRLGSIGQTWLDSLSDQSDLPAPSEVEGSDLSAPSEVEGSDLSAPSEVEGSDLPAPSEVEGSDQSDQSDQSDLSDPSDLSDTLCTPNCAERVCGPDGCGGICGLCPTGKPNCVLGKCKACAPSCSAKECGDDGCGGVCGVCPTGFSCQQSQCTPPPCDQSTVLFWESFDDCSQGAFEILDFQTEDSVSWLPVSTKPFVGTCALYLGDPNLGLYDTQGRVTLSLLSPTFQLPASPPASVQFRLWAQAEPVPAPQYPYDYDVLYLYVRDQAGGDTLVFSSKQLLNDTGGNYKPVAADLQQFAGQTVRLVFQFDTLDSIDNEYAGFYLDELRVLSTCPYCTKDAQCASTGTPSCAAPACVRFANNSAAGTCTEEPIVACCTLESEEYCDDADPCTLDSCDPTSQTCAHQPSTIPGC